MMQRNLLLSVFLFCYSQAAFSQDQLSDSYLVADSAGEVSLEQQEDFSLNYKKRRSKNGALFAVSMEKFYPIEYRSLFDDSFIEDIVGSDTIDLVGFELGYKRNFGPMSASILGVFSKGAIVGSFGSLERTISLSKFGLSANIALDAVFNEPWVVPYFQAGVHQFNVTEDKPTESQSATTGFSINYRYGVLFQLDWLENSIDKSAKQDRLRSSGLENTYLDIYFSTHLASGDAIDPVTLGKGDPNMLSNGEMGIGLKMEF